MKANRALDAALALARNPGLAASMRGRPLPSGIPLLLQILAGESDMVSSAAEALKLDQRSVRFAVEHYVQTVMLFAGAEPQRVLGVAPGATRGEMRTHLRWLMHWLHPDYNPAAWRSAFASRVLTAWREASSSDAVRGRPAFSDPTSRRRSARPPLPVYPPRLAWVARPLQEKRRIAWPRAAGLCLALITLVTLAVGDNRVQSVLRDLAAAFRTLTAID